MVSGHGKEWDKVSESGSAERALRKLEELAGHRIAKDHADAVRDYIETLERKLKLAGQRGEHLAREMSKTPVRAREVFGKIVGFALCIDVDASEESWLAGKYTRLTYVRSGDVLRLRVAEDELCADVTERRRYVWPEDEEREGDLIFLEAEGKSFGDGGLGRRARATFLFKELAIYSPPSPRVEEPCADVASL